MCPAHTDVQTWEGAKLVTVHNIMPSRYKAEIPRFTMSHDPPVRIISFKLLNGSLSKNSHSFSLDSKYKNSVSKISGNKRNKLIIQLNCLVWCSVQVIVFTTRFWKWQLCNRFHLSLFSTARVWTCIHPYTHMGLGFWCATTNPQTGSSWRISTHGLQLSCLPHPLQAPNALPKMMFWDPVP